MLQNLFLRQLINKKHVCIPQFQEVGLIIYMLLNVKIMFRKNHSRVEPANFYPGDRFTVKEKKNQNCSCNTTIISRSPSGITFLLL